MVLTCIHTGSFYLHLKVKGLVVRVECIYFT